MRVPILTVVLIGLILHDIFAKIINGYERDIEKVRLSIVHLRQLLAENPQFSRKDTRTLHATLSELNEVLIYYEITDTLLQKFRQVAPDLYAQIDTLKDHRSRIVDVYVKFVPLKSDGMPYGMTVVSVTSGEEMAVSPYGEGTAGVTVAVVNTSLAVLSHEFGHLQHIVPNLSEYAKYYKVKYRVGSSGNAPGHECDDISGRLALRFEGRYRQRYNTYLREAHDYILPYDYLRKARKRLEDEKKDDMWRLAGEP